MTEETQEESVIKGPGEALKNRRLALGLSIEEIADKLHLRPAVVSELEEDVIDHRVGTTFTKGYVRLYAKHLELDPEPLLKAFDDMASPVKQPAKLRSFSQKMARQTSDSRLMWLSYFIIFLVIAMIVVWGIQQASEQVSFINTGDEDTVQQSNPTSTSEVAAPSVTETIPETVNTTLSAPAIENQVISQSTEMSEQLQSAEAESTETNGLRADAAPSQNTLLTEEGSIEATSGSAESSDTETTEAQDSLLASDINEPGVESDFAREPETSELVFTFAENCWMNLTDATGENIAYGEKIAGRVMPVSGIPPFEVVLGAPQSVQITVDGQPYDMSQFPAGRTARFTIGAPSQ